MRKIVCLGELLLRLSPINHERFVQAKKFEVTYGGSEANVAVTIANFGGKAEFITKLPDSEIGQSAMNNLRNYGVDTKNIVLGGSRIGVYYFENGSDPRPSRVIYDRSDSSLAQASGDDFKWDEIMKDAGWFHFSGITPAISDNVSKITMDAVRAAKKAGVTVSMDLNYRKKMWTSGKTNKVIMELLRYCDVIIGCFEDIENIFEIDKIKTDWDMECIAKDIFKRFKPRCVAIPQREVAGPSCLNWHGAIYNGVKLYKSKNYKITHVIDKIGTGDAFGAGIIYGLNSGYDLQKTLEFATASSCLKNTVGGDFNHISFSEAEDLLCTKDYIS